MAWLAVWAVAFVHAVSGQSLARTALATLALWWVSQVAKNVVGVTAAGVTAGILPTAILEKSCVRM